MSNDFPFVLGIEPTEIGALHRVLQYYIGMAKGRPGTSIVPYVPDFSEILIYAKIVARIEGLKLQLDLMEAIKDNDQKRLFEVLAKAMPEKKENVIPDK